MEVKPRLTLEQLKQLERTERDAGQSKRLRVVILAMEGWTAPADLPPGSEPIVKLELGMPPR